jgi:hypothetical protein
MKQKVIHDPSAIATAPASDNLPQLDNRRKRCRADILPQSLAPRGLSRAQAAAYVGISPSLFDEMVADSADARPKADQQSRSLG